MGYDLRGGSSAAIALGRAGQHPAVLEVGLRQALMQLPELEQQTSIARSNVQSINLCPIDSNRLAFHLASGWSGQPSQIHALLMWFVRGCVKMGYVKGVQVLDLCLGHSWHKGLVCDFITSKTCKQVAYVLGIMLTVLTFTASAAAILNPANELHQPALA